MNAPPKKLPLLQTTNQSSKLIVVVYAIGFGIILLVVCASAAGAVSGFTLFCLSLIGVALILLGIYNARAIRCPECKLSWLLWSMSNNYSIEWHNWVLTTTTCPKCGFGADKASAPIANAGEK